MTSADIDALIAERQNESWAEFRSNTSPVLQLLAEKAPDVVAFAEASFRNGWLHGYGSASELISKRLDEASERLKRGTRP